MRAGGMLILTTRTNSIFRHVQNAEKFNFFYVMQRDDDINAG